MLQDALARRRQKKDKLKQLIKNLAEEKDKDDHKFADKVVKIEEKESSEITRIDKTIKKERVDMERQLKEDIATKRKAKLAEMEKKLDDFKRKNKGGEDHEFLFADMLTQYGNLVKKVDADLADERKL